MLTISLIIHPHIIMKSLTDAVTIFSPLFC